MQSLERFVQAQQPVMGAVLAELAAGAKRTHWMWFVFPQLAALGRSATARHFGIADLAEAQAYMQHPVLGPRLGECCRALLRVDGRTANQILGSPDDMKLRSCATLFEAAAPGEQVFPSILERFFDGARDGVTLELLRDAGSSAPQLPQIRPS